MKNYKEKMISEFASRMASGIATPSAKFLQIIKEAQDAKRDQLIDYLGEAISGETSTAMPLDETREPDPEVWQDMQNGWYTRTYQSMLNYTTVDPLPCPVCGGRPTRNREIEVVPYFGHPVATHEPIEHEHITRTYCHEKRNVVSLSCYSTYVREYANDVTNSLIRAWNVAVQLNGMYLDEAVEFLENGGLAGVR